MEFVRSGQEQCGPLQHIVDDYYPLAFEFIRTQLKPSYMLCSVVGLCSKLASITEHFQRHRPPSQVKLSPAQRKLAPGALNERLYVPASVVQANSPSCVMCEYVINSLDNSSKTGATRPRSRRPLESICDKMPGSVKAM